MEFDTTKLEREVYCFQCKKYSHTDKTNPECECGNNLITVVYNSITGDRITGRKEQEE